MRVACSQQKGESVVQRVALASVAAAALLVAAPVDAKVILQQPQLKKALVTDDSPAAAPAAKKELILPKDRKAAAAARPAAAKAPAMKAAPSVSSQGGDIDPKDVALPGVLVAIAGGAFALTKVDEGFADFMDTASAKNSNDDGAGYETILKSGALLGGKKAAGTKRVKAASKSGTQSSSPLSSIFGSKDE